MTTNGEYVRSSNCYRQKHFFMGDLQEKNALFREVGRKIPKEKVNYRKEIEKQLGSVVCINLQADEP